jgi:hypothetical protein
MFMLHTLDDRPTLFDCGRTRERLYAKRSQCARSRDPRDLCIIPETFSGVSSFDVDE